jgi:hypothetical protein
MGEGGREREWGAESRREDRREELAAEHPHWRRLERGVSSREGAGGGVVSGGRGARWLQPCFSSTRSFHTHQAVGCLRPE